MGGGGGQDHDVCGSSCLMRIRESDITNDGAPFPPKSLFFYLFVNISHHDHPLFLLSQGGGGPWKRGCIARVTIHQFRVCLIKN